VHGFVRLIGESRVVQFSLLEFRWYG